MLCLRRSGTRLQSMRRRGICRCTGENGLSSSGVQLPPQELTLSGQERPERESDACGYSSRNLRCARVSRSCASHDKAEKRRHSSQVFNPTIRQQWSESNRTGNVFPRASTFNCVWMHGLQELIRVLSITEPFQRFLKRQHQERFSERKNSKKRAMKRR